MTLGSDKVYTVGKSEIMYIHVIYKLYLQHPHQGSSDDDHFVCIIWIWVLWIKTFGHLTVQVVLLILHEAQLESISTVFVDSDIAMIGHH